MKNSNFHINSQEELIKAIRFTSGGIGVDQFKNSVNIFEFFEWYMTDLLYCSEEKQKVGKKVINEIVNIFLEPVKIMSDFPNPQITKMEHSDFYINRVMNYGYTREEAINILNGKNPDGNNFVELPF